MLHKILCLNTMACHFCQNSIFIVFSQPTGIWRNTHWYLVNTCLELRGFVNTRLALRGFVNTLLALRGFVNTRLALRGFVNKTTSICKYLPLSVLEAINYRRRRRTGNETKSKLRPLVSPSLYRCHVNMGTPDFGDPGSPKLYRFGDPVPKST